MKKNFILKNNWYVWRKTLCMLCILSCTFVAYAQQRVNGTVVGSNSEPIIGASVVEKGTSNGVVTDISGKFTLNVAAGKKLLITYVGYVSKEITAAANLSIVLEEDINILESVVVIGYGTLDKKLVTSSIKSIQAEELPTGLGGSTIANAMEGKVSGLIMSQTASPNSSLTLQLRGMASVNTSRAPLVVIDGMPGGDIRSVVQEDIQSIDILKDASAGAIYGTRATGGVILITTKQAKEGKMKLSYTGEMTLKKNYGRPDILSSEEFTQYRSALIDHGNNVNWWNEGMADNPTSYRHLATLQGGTENSKIYATLMYEDNRGVLMGDNRKDVSGRINGSFKTLEGWLDINTHIDYRQANRNQSKPNVGQLIGNNPTRSPYDSSTLSGYNIWLNDLDDYNTIADAAMTDDKGLDKWFRPDVELKLNILPIKGLSYTQSIGYENRQWERRYYQSMNSRPQLNVGIKGKATLEFSKTELLNSDGYFSYVNQFGDNYINAIAGYSYFEQNGESFSMTNQNFSVDGIKMWDIGKGSWLSDGKAEMSSSKQITQRLSAYFARVNYSYKYKYTATASFRKEGSSKFAVDNRWGNFWSLSASWRLSNEDFLKNISWINDLNVRAGYGVTGNEGFAADYAATMYGSDTYWKLPNGDWVYSYGITKNINRELGWEEKHEWNIGAEYSLFDNRLYGKIDFYRRNVEGLIYNVEVPQPPYTESQMYKNIGTLKNTGWEFEIGGDVVRSKDWNYSTSLTLSHNETSIGSLWGNNTYYDGASTGWGGSVHRIEENAKVGSFFVWRFAGFDNGGFLIYDKDGNKVDGASTKRVEDKQYVGNFMPLLIAGWSHNLKYKNWELSMTLTSRIKADVYNHVEQALGFQAGSKGNVLRDAFVKHNDITGQVLATDYFLEDASFLKIQNVNLSYLFKSKKYLKLVDNIRFYLAANNVYTFTKYSGLNPEVDITGWESGIEWNAVYPQTRTCALGIQVNF
ncbi:TonB-dependent receptor SusC [termite gut metagenome]|uniref:TonB-dependent receptor SusC n=1 Tax=termite gut metagenome TaxID=433724 RepID=A0A5J4SKX7_9ZZZZ